MPSVTELLEARARLGGTAIEEIELMDQFLYLAPGARTPTKCRTNTMPHVAQDSVRVVCISDTHNEHQGLRLPEGDLLIHSGDCLTESGKRYVKRENGLIKRVDPAGEALFVQFAEWFGAQNFPFKVLVAGNHDLVLQGLGKVRVQQILDDQAVHGKSVYLEHEEVSIGGIKVFGSPFAHWGGKNDAFFAKTRNFKDMPDGMHVVVTHMPAILPGEGEVLDEDVNLTETLHRTGALLHVSGHCHWAHGVYHSEGSSGQIPCVIASVCDSHWRGLPRCPPLASASGVRGDPKDKTHGGYNLNQAGIVCDIKLPGGRPELLQAESPTPTAATDKLSSEADGLAEEALGRPAMLFFGPPNDPSVVRTMLPKLRESFDVDWVDSALDGIHAVANRSYVALVAKLGTKGNLGTDVIAALREIQDEKPFVVIHSATAAANHEMQAKLKENGKCNLIVGPRQESALFEALHPLAISTNSETSSTTILAGKPALLLFGPPNDPKMVHRVMPQMEAFFHVTHVESAEQGIKAISTRSYDACIAKLGTENNLGVDVIKAFRSRYGKKPFVAVHSSKAAADPAIQKVLQDEFDIDLFVSCDGPIDESALMIALAEHANSSDDAPSKRVGCTLG